MAASRGRRLLWHGRCWFSQTESGVPPQPPDSLYPPIVASATAKSKAAKRRRLEHFNQRVHAAASIEEKLRLYGQLQRPKYMLYPQTFALNADRWYRSFTKTVFVPGLPPRAAAAAAKAPGAVAPEAAETAAGVAPEAAKAPEPGTAAPEAAKSPEVAAAAAPYLDMGELRSLACDALLQESFYQNKKRPFLYRDQDHTPGPFLTQLVSTLAAFLCGRNPLLAASSLGVEWGWEGEGSGSPWVGGPVCEPGRSVPGVAELFRSSLVIQLVPIVPHGASGFCFFCFIAATEQELGGV